MKLEVVIKLGDFKKECKSFSKTTQGNKKKKKK